jgi:Domain of unknown function (DUF4398)
MSRLVACLLFCLSPIAVACGAPPSKELHQAQGAIDAARAAGADTYAVEDYTAAVDARARAEEAVRQRDYRLALSLALDSRERAQSAAKVAASQKAQVRSEAERMLAEVTAAIAQASDRQKAGDRLPKDAAQALTGAIGAARTAIDDAGKALASEDYLEARRRLQGVTQALRAAIPPATPAPASRPARRTR